MYQYPNSILSKCKCGLNSCLINYEAENLQKSILRGIHKVFAYLQQENLLKEEIVVQDEIDHLHAFIDGLALHVLMGFVAMDKKRLYCLIEKEIDKNIKA
ncbi:hypothetical protein ABIA69_003635 [Lysinibacillus parviboronicapiens]|uniref:TetR family transcriptional regulator n=1 Tax=Lysinibacillus parviboronicapiens TaxID=436516 RepID=A0ABV2PNB0_9BACI